MEWLYLLTFGVFSICLYSFLTFFDKLDKYVHKINGKWLIYGPISLAAIIAGEQSFTLIYKTNGVLSVKFLSFAGLYVLLYVLLIVAIRPKLNSLLSDVPGTLSRPSKTDKD